MILQGHMANKSQIIYILILSFKICHLKYTKYVFTVFKIQIQNSFQNKTLLDPRVTIIRSNLLNFEFHVPCLTPKDQQIKK